MMHRSGRLALAFGLLSCACAAEDPSTEPSAASAPTAAHLDDGCDCERPTAARAEAEPECGSAPAASAPELPATRDPISLGDSPRLGPADAAVVVVLSADLECGYCARSLGTMRRLARAYPDRVAVVWKHNPLPMHEHARGAAVAAEAARVQGKFWEMVALLMASQDRLDREGLLDAARQLGLDLGAFERDLGSADLAQRVRADQELVQSLGGRGAPTFWINGRRLVGDYPLDAFRALVEQELSGER